MLYKETSRCSFQPITSVGEVKKSVPKVVELIGWVFANTERRGRFSHGIGVKLRDVVVSFLTLWQDELLGWPSYMNLLDRGGEFVKEYNYFVIKHARWRPGRRLRAKWEE